MTDLRTAAKAALWAFQYHIDQTWPTDRSTVAIAALRAALAQQEEPQTLDDALTLPRATAQAYENGYKAGVAHEREACAQVCEARFVGDLTREDMEARRCAAAIRARGVQL
jgi:hypothetical protein